LEEGLLVPARKNKREKIVEEGSFSAQEGGAQQNYVPPYGGIPTPPSYYEGPPMQAWGSGAAVPLQNYVVPNVTFAEPYAQYPQPQQSMAIIGVYAARNMQNVAAIQSNVTQLGEGNANIAYELGCLLLVSRINLLEGMSKPIMREVPLPRPSVPTTSRRLGGGALVFFSFPFSLIFSLCLLVFA
jgi:hypothetical protein